MRTLALPTPHGPANAHLHLVDEPRAALVLGHGAGGGVAARDLVAVTAVARAEQIAVVLVEQPYRVAGRRSPPPAAQLDAACTAEVARLLDDELQIHLAPVLLGEGVRLFDRLGPAELEATRVIASPAVTHLTFRTGITLRRAEEGS